MAENWLVYENYSESSSAISIKPCSSQYALAFVCFQTLQQIHRYPVGNN